MENPFFNDFAQSGGENVAGVLELASDAETVAGTNTTKAVTPAGLAAKLGDINALVYKGVIDCSTTPNYPAANAGDVYVVSVEGKIGGASGSVVVAGDLALCKTDSTASSDQATVGAQWDIVEKNIDLTNVTITGGAINGTIIGGTTPGKGIFSPSISKGPAIINSGFVGTVTASASTTVVFSSAADAILAGYDSVNPLLGTTLISNVLTRYIQSWTNSTTCVVDAGVTWAGTAITSVKAPLSFEVTSEGVLKRATYADGSIVSMAPILPKKTFNEIPATITNNDFETLGIGGADVFGSWTEAADTIGDITADTGYMGTYSCKITESTSSNLSRITSPAITLTPGCRYRFLMNTHGDGTHAGRYQINNIDGGNTIVSTGIISTEWTPFHFDFSASITAAYPTITIVLLAPVGIGNYAGFDNVQIVRIDNTFKDPCGINILGIGDSKTLGNVGDDISLRGWLGQLPTGFTEMPGRIAKSGASVASALGFISYGVVNTTGLTPDAICISFGTNELESMPIQATWIANYKLMLNFLHTRWPNTIIYLMRPWGSGYDTQSATLHTWINTIVADLSSYVRLGPDEAVFLKGSDNGATYLSGGAGVHPNAAGYLLTAQQWASVISADQGLYNTLH